MNKKRLGGFTIAELSVVIAVIGILVTITAVSYGVVQAKARAASLITTAQKVEGALRLAATKQNSELWLRDTVFTGTSNPRIDLIAKADYVPTTPEAITLRDALGGEVTTSGLKDVTWVYVNSGSVRVATACDGGNVRSGVLLAVSPITAQLAKEVDKQADDSNLGCGKIRHSGTTLLYQLGFDQRIQ